MTDLVISGWRGVLLRLFLKVRSWALIVPALEVELFSSRRLERKSSGCPSRRNALTQRSLSKSRKMGACVSANGTVYVVKVKQEKSRDLIADSRKPGKLRKKEVRKLLETVIVNSALVHDAPRRFVANGGSRNVSLFSKQGLKGVNQDAMLVLEDFAAQTDTKFCGVFDGHGPDGHLVARSVRNLLPQKLASCWQDTFPYRKDGISQDEGGFSTKTAGDPQLITAWKESFMKAHKLMDRELLMHDEVDCVSSGTTAVTLVKQGNDLFIGNVGDSRAVLGMMADDNSLMALQLTIDLKPNLPKEAERIKRLKGRVFALRNEPSVKRVWLPHINTPGLAMARSLGDYCLKNFGVISEPVITYRRLSPKDRFVVLASDGVWDVLSNEQVIEIVASVPVRSLAAEAVVEAAAYVWRLTRPMSRVDDCTAVCFFLDDLATASVAEGGKDNSIRKRVSTVVSVHHKLTLTEDESAAGSGGVELLTVSAINDVDVLPTSARGIKKRKLPA